MRPARAAGTGLADGSALHKRDATGRRRLLASPVRRGPARRAASMVDSRPPS